MEPAQAQNISAASVLGRSLGAAGVVLFASLEVAGDGTPRGTGSGVAK